MSHLYMCKSSKNMEKSKISLVPSISVQKAVLDCETMKKTHNEDSCPSCLLLLLLLIPVSFLVLLAIVLVCLIPKYKARKAMRENVPKDPGDTPMEGELYENVCKDQAGAGDSQEIHYATPVFQEAARREQETCHDCKTGHVYSELTL
ncbi:allergin-1 isoform X6 [Heterocephalus glaber]|uniref:Allergin-1 isoform X6 n=1 Tax=Heterocephalus glaber TaxID=10181 RepID=A0AAX6S5V6_HETGA|nr:allergin-1 isoform X6 [Heterocephalus glaber]